MATRSRRRHRRRARRIRPWHGLLLVAVLLAVGLGSSLWWSSWADDLTGSSGESASAGNDGPTGAGASISGTVRGPGGAPVPGATVRAYLEGTPAYFPSAKATTGADGAYVLTGLPPGQHQVQIQPPADAGLGPQWYARQDRRATAEPLEVDARSALTDVNGVLDLAGTVTGRVGGAGLLVMAYAPGDTWVGSYQTLSGPDGSYTLTGIPTGPFEVAVRRPDGMLAWYRQSSRASAPPLTLSGGRTLSGVDILAGA